MTALLVIACIVAYVLCGAMTVFVLTRLHEDTREFVRTDDAATVVIALFWPLWLVGVPLIYWIFIPLYKFFTWTGKVGSER